MNSEQLELAHYFGTLWFAIMVRSANRGWKLPRNFSKCGSLGTDGSVAYLFTRRLLTVGADENALMDAATGSRCRRRGDEDASTIRSTPNDFGTMLDGLEAAASSRAPK